MYVQRRSCWCASTCHGDKELMILGLWVWLNVQPYLWRPYKDLTLFPCDSLGHTFASKPYEVGFHLHQFIKADGINV